MDKFLKFCQDLDELGYYQEVDNNFLKFASNQNELLRKQILIPGKVREMALKAYHQRNKDIKFGTIEDIEIARQTFSKKLLRIRNSFESS